MTGIANSTNDVLTIPVGVSSAVIAPSSNTTGIGTVNLSAIPIGPTGTTQRKVYRTTAGGSQLKLLTTIADNTSTTYSDTTADASLGTNASTSNTSGLVSASGQTLPGSTSLPVAGTSGFYSGGGWVEAANQILRYTGLGTNTITGIPASGAGSITAAISYNSTVTEVPSLTGVTGLNSAVLRGSVISVWTQRDSAGAQAIVAAAEGGDGIHEDLLVNENLQPAQLDAACDAMLSIFASAITTVNYASLDNNTRSGATVHIATGAPLNLTGDYVIQSVDITEIGLPGKAPKYTVVASSVKFTFEDMLRRLLLG
jgi:hypothetical protein